MSFTLSTARTQVEQRLEDTANLIWSENTIDEALRSALAELSNTYGSAVALKDLDSALLTTYDDLDHNTLIIGAVAYALRFRLINKLDEHFPTLEDPDDLFRIATNQMTLFQSLLTQIRLRRFAESTDTPYSQWEWDEGTDFS